MLHAGASGAKFRRHKADTREYPQLAQTCRSSRPAAVVAVTEFIPPLPQVN